MKFLVLFFVGAVFGLANIIINPTSPPFRRDHLNEGEVPVSGLLQRAMRQEPLIILDARDSEAFEIASIPSAINLNLSNYDFAIGTFLDVWYPEFHVIVFCDSMECGVSKELADRLKRDMGIETVWVLKDGWRAWQALPDQEKKIIEEYVLESD